MKIYGVAFLALCFLVGQLAGELLGIFMKIDGNVGGVGFSMMLLILFGDRIPVIIAMSATQNVKAALNGGWVVLIVGVFATAACFMLVPLVSRIGQTDDLPIVEEVAL
jgi:hypothetical protein